MNDIYHKTYKMMFPNSEIIPNGGTIVLTRWDVIWCCNGYLATWSIDHTYQTRDWANPIKKIEENGGTYR
jgi:hypothetical protein